MKIKTVLFIDDEVFRNEAMFEMLNFDYDCHWAKSPNEAYELLSQSEPFDMIILDVMLPVDHCFNEEERLKCNNGDDTGLILAEKLQSYKKTKNTPIILASARPDLNIDNLKNVKWKLTKPFYYQELKDGIEKNIKEAKK